MKVKTYNKFSFNKENIKLSKFMNKQFKVLQEQICNKDEVIKVQAIAIKNLEEKLKSHPTITYSQVLMLIIFSDFLNPLAILKTPWFYYTKNFWDRFAKDHKITANEVLRMKFLDVSWKRYTWFSLLMLIVFFQHFFPNRTMRIKAKITKFSNWIWSKTIGRFDCDSINEV